MWKKLWKTLHQSFLFVSLCLGIIVGTILGLVFRVEFFVSPFWVGFVVLLFIFALFKPNYLFVIIIFLGGILLAFFRTSTDISGDRYISQFINENIKISGRIIEDPNFDEDKTTLKLNELLLDDKEEKGTVFVQLSETELSVQRGDRITLVGKISEGFGNFSGAMYRPKILNIAKAKPENFFLGLRNWFSERISRFIPEEESSLGLAYLLGMKNGLSSEVIEMLRIVGLTHIVVASGTHLGILVSVVRKIFGRLSRFSGLLFSVLFIFIFGGMVGWTPSILRASIVTILSLLAWYVGRKFEGWRIILISMAITLLIDPMFISNLGWQLSFLSFSGILILEPKLKKLFFGEKKVSRVFEIILVTISAQILCLPILIYYFGSISLVSVVANMLILPTMPVVMGLTFFTGIFGDVEFFGMIFGKITTFLIDYHLEVMRFFSAQRMFVLNLEPKNPLVFLLYLLIFIPILISVFRNRIKMRKETRL